MSTAIRASLFDSRSVDALLRAADPVTAGILERSLAGRSPTVSEGAHLLRAEGDGLVALLRVADHVRTADVGDDVTYVVNRNINFTNVCFVGCQFCAFARLRNDVDARTDSHADVLEKIRIAIERGATEVCIQGGINPELDAFVYRDLLRAIKQRFPRLHVHAFSPMEIMYGARRTGMEYREYLTMLKEAGLDTIPGTAAEILDDEVREVLSRKKVDVRTWVEIISTAHRVGIRTTATVLYGHIETPEHVAAHIDLVRSMQRETGGFTEFVPLRFIHTYTALYQKGLVNPPPKGIPDMRMYAVCRLMLRGLIDNLQTSWVKLGVELAQLSLAAGCNDFGGTLMEEQISKSAGADAGEYLPPAQIRTVIAEMGRVPIQRTTTYGRIAADESAGDGLGRRGGGGAVAPGPSFTP